MNHQLLVAEFLATPWALMPERLHALAGVVMRWSAGAAVPPEAMTRIQADREARQARRQATAAQSTGSIAVLPLYGVITQRGNMVDDVSGPGSTSTQQFAAALRTLLADHSVSQILIDIDSPGGSVYGVAELADEIQSARAQKPVVAIANSLAASAAYWIGCAASEFYVTPGGEVGSIGVWQAHQDFSKALEEAGVKTTLISAGKYKVEGNPYSALDEEAQAFMQSRVDDYYAAFTKAVAKGRGVPISQVRDGMGLGRVLGADSAVQQGMVDDVATFDQVLSRMRRAAKSTVTASPSRLQRAKQSLALL
jgi:signal peptide peptidase SppA